MTMRATPYWPFSSMLAVFTVSFLHLAAAGPISFGHQTVTRREQDFPVRPTLDESLLAVQVGSIVGAYLIVVAILLSLLFIVGRRLRRQIQSSNCTLQVEMITPGKPTASTDPSPITPISTNPPSLSKASGFTMSWSSLTKGHRHQASGNTSVVTIDESVVASDRRRAQDEMEMLYAAVMEHDAQKAAGINDSKPSFPPTQEEDPPSAPTSPRSNSRLSKISPLSLFNNSNSRGSVSSGKLRSPRRSIRKLPISPPIRSPDITSSDSYGEDQVPLTPRLYNPGPPPATPQARVSLGKPPGRAPAPAPLSLATAVHSSSSLPFREAFPPQSAPATKTTILERPEHLRHGPRTGAATPYSPYMPFTPVTPITPSRMVTKRQRKREDKENGLRVLIEDDMVKSDDDMWGY